ncbi:MAG: hypothetical protein MJ162_01970 [Treponema sp.]|nr:hypothetical protein [Treponema sp.]
MKKLTKVALMVLAASLMVTNVTAAKKKSGSKGGDPYKNVEKQKDPKTKKVYNFDGMHVDLVDWWAGEDWEARPVASKQEEDERAYHNWLRSTYNFSFTQKQIAGWDSHPQAVSNFCITGGKQNYVFTIDGRSAIIGIRAGLFYDLSKLTCIDWSNPKWASGTEKMLNKGKSFYFMRPLQPEPRGGMFFNKRLLEEAGINPDEPYDLQAAGKWTWENFEKLVAKCTYDIDNDGINDAWGMANSSTEFLPLAAISNGTPMIGFENGKFVNNMGTEAVLEAATWAAHMATTYEMPQPEGSEWNWMYPAFIEGKVAFIADQEYHAQSNGTFSDMADDWGFVCFPKGPRSDGKYRTLHNDNMYVIPGCYDDERAEKIAKIFDLWTDKVPGYDSPDAWKEGFYPMFRDARAVDETLQYMLNTPSPRYDTFVPDINYMGSFIWTVYPGYTTPQQAYEDTKNEFQGLLDDANR